MNTAAIESVLAKQRSHRRGLTNIEYQFSQCNQDLAAAVDKNICHAGVLMITTKHAPSQIEHGRAFQLIDTFGPSGFAAGQGLRRAHDAAAVAASTSDIETVPEWEYNLGRKRSLESGCTLRCSNFDGNASMDKVRQ
jgi:hypothetical protein